MDNEPEYKVLGGHPEDVQKKLNQWRHIYHLDVINFQANEAQEVVVLLTRVRRAPSLNSVN